MNQVGSPSWEVDKVIKPMENSKSGRNCIQEHGND